MLLKFLADNMNFSEVLNGIDNLTPEQIMVLFEKVKAELIKQGRQSVIYDTTATEIASEPITIKRDLSENGIKPKSSIECCLHCGSIAIKRKGYTKGGVQRYLCKDCGKSFSENYGLITHYTHLAEYVWLEVIRGIITGLSISVMAKNLGKSTSTIWLCRMKIYQMLQSIYQYNDTFNNIVEADGKYERISFKGCKDRSYFFDKLGRLPRHHRSRAERIEYLGDDYARLFKSNPHLLKEMVYSSNRRMVGRDTIDINHQHVCIITAVDRANNIFVKPATSGTAKAKDINKLLAGRITTDAVLVTDEHNGYKYLSRENHIEHVVVPSSVHSLGAYNLARINSLHSAIDRFFGGGEYLPATKYLDLYLMAFWWIQKQKDLTQNELVQRLFYIATGHVSNEARANMSRVTRSSLLQRALPIDTKNLY